MGDLLLTGMDNILVTMGYVKLDIINLHSTVTQFKYQRGSDIVSLQLFHGDLYVMLSCFRGDDLRGTEAAETINEFLNWLNEVN